MPSLIARLRAVIAGTQTPPLAGPVTPAISAGDRFISLRARTRKQAIEAYGADFETPDESADEYGENNEHMGV